MLSGRNEFEMLKERMPMRQSGVGEWVRYEATVAVGKRCWWLGLIRKC